MPSIIVLQNHISIYLVNKNNLRKMGTKNRNLLFSDAIINSSIINPKT